MDILVVAVQEIFEPLRLFLLFCGVIAGLVLGVIPGLGGLFGLALLIPVTYGLDPYAAFALLLGMGSVTTTSDTIPAVLLGVPGTVGSAATVVDGHAMAKNNEAARAFGAAYTASLFGGIFGALILALSIPIMRPLVTSLGTTDFLAISIFGLSIVAVLSGPEPSKGFGAAILGMLVSFVGIDSQEGVERWTFDMIYLWDGLPLIAVFLGVFGIPELASLMSRGRIATSTRLPENREIYQGIRDALQNWGLVLRCSFIGTFLGAIPGVGLSVIDWIAYGHATRKPAKDIPYGEGNVRGVIAPEAANNAKEGGALIPTIAFGVPGSASMSILLGAFMMHGLVPGPDLLGKNASITVSMVLSIALANVIGAAICLLSTRQLARIALLPAVNLVPLTLVFVVLGAFNTGKSYYDLMFLLAFGVIGIGMRHLNWPRAAFALGFVLGPSLERFFFISYQVDGWTLLYAPSIIILTLLTAISVTRSVLAWRKARLFRVRNRYHRLDIVVLALTAAMGVYVLLTANDLPFAAGIFPMMAGGALVATSLFSLIRNLTLTSNAVDEKSVPKIHGSLTLDMALIAAAVLAAASTVVFGHIAGPVLFVLLWLLIIARAKPSNAVLTAGITGFIIYGIFDFALPQTWPDSLVAVAMNLL